jgi:hypothetical protein
MFLHRNLAVQGLSPGDLSTRSVANLGTFEVEVIITPIQPPSSGGGYVGGYSKPLPRQFRITVRVKFNGKIYEDSQIVDEHRARVIAKFRGITVFSSTDPMVSVNGMQILDKNEIQIRVTKK